MTEDTHTKEIEFLKQVLPDNYHDIEFFKEGGTRRLYQAKWGPADEEVVIKIDREELESPRAKRHVSRGCDTRNDVMALAKIRKIENPEFHSINRLNDFIVLEDGKVISIESKFDDAPNLEELVKEKGPLKVKEFEEVFSQVLEAVGYLNYIVGLYHRDNKPSNILIGENLEVRLTDLANACRKDHPSEKYLPTAGGHFVMDPLLIGEFTEDERRYNDQSELFAVGVNMYYALTGKYIFEYDPDNGTAVDFKERSLLDENGKLDKTKHEQALEEALTELPNEAGKYAKIIRRLLTTDEKSRYKSIENLIWDFEKKKKPHWLRGVFSKSVLTAALLSTLALGSIAGLIGYKVNKNLETAIEDSRKYEVIANWDDLEIQNNLVRLGMRFHEEPQRVTKDHYKTKYLVAKPGEKLDVTVTAKEIIEATEGIGYHLDGKVYIEGFPAITFPITPEPPDFEPDEFSGYIGFKWIDLMIPKDIQEGTYTLVSELCVPEKPNIGEDSAFEKLKFPKPGTVIARKRIPIVIGNPKNQLCIEALTLGIYEYLTMKNLVEYEFKDRPSLTYEVSIAGTNFKNVYENEKGDFLNMRLSNPSHTYQRTLQIVVKDKDKIIGYQFVPIKGHKIGDNVNWYEFSIPTKEFSETLERYRRVLYESHNQSR